MKWGRAFDPNAELIWVGGTLGMAAETRHLMMVKDTGTPRTLIERSVAESLGLTEDLRIGYARFKGVAGPPVRGYRIVADRFEAFGRVLNNFEVICLELSEELDVDGLIGLDFFRGLKVLTDYQAGFITLET